MESNDTASSLSVLSVVPDKAPDPTPDMGEGATFLVRHFQPFEFEGRIFVTESDGSTGEYITTHGPFYTEQDAMIETVGMTSQEILDNYCTA